MRWVENVTTPAEITICTIVHAPVVTGYWAEAPDVLSLFFESVRDPQVPELDLMVVDNGSCEQVRALLHDYLDNGTIQFLLTSRRNLGKLGAWNLLFSAAPGSIISYADSDAFFLPGWLSESIKILQSFPEAGLVTAQPIVGGDLSLSATARAARLCPDITTVEGVLIPEEYVRACLRGLGADEEEYQRRQLNRNDFRVTKNSISAYTTASHFQFTTFRSVLEAIFPLETTRPLGDDVEFDRKLEEHGYWRLSTIDYLVHHMGNEAPLFADELPWVSWPATSGGGRSRSGFRSQRKRSSPALAPLVRSPRVRNVIKRMVAAGYRLLYN